MKPRYREPGFLGGLRNCIRLLADAFGAYRTMPNMVELGDGSVWLKLRDSYSVQPNPVTLPETNQFADADGGMAYRGEIAMDFVDPDVYGFMVFMLKRSDDGNAVIEFRTQTKGQWVRAFTFAFARVIEGVNGSGQE